MKKIVLFLPCILSLFLLTPFPALAHFPESDGDISSLLHVDPNDNPIPGQNATMYFLFDDETNRFNLSECKCIVTVYEHGKRILSGQIYANRHVGVYGTGIPIIFPNRDAYSIQLHGTPLKQGEFQPFNLSWTFRVNQYPLGVENSFSINDVLIPIGLTAIATVGLLGGTILIVIGIKQMKEQRKPK